jgi:predicted amidohydrolase YtcJ
MKTHYFLLLLFLFSCTGKSKQSVDLLIEASAIYTMDENVPECTSMLVHNGKIVALGSKDSLLQLYNPLEIRKVEGYIYPSFIDAHCHFISLAKTTLNVDLTGAASWQEVLDRCIDFANNYPNAWINGRGWDHSLWEVAELPTNEELNTLFPETPVFIRRIDGHAGLANKKALELAGLNEQTSIEGGELLKNKNGQLTGLLIDNAMQAVNDLIPAHSRPQLIKAIIKTASYLNSLGLSTLADAGMSYDDVMLIDSLQQEGVIKLRIYAMLHAEKANLHIASAGQINKPELVMRSFKLYADGALGSEGAKLKKHYCTNTENHGLLLLSPDSLKWWYQKIYNLGFQAHTHCIGDSANALVLNLYNEVMQNNPQLRWRIEHAQVVDTSDFKLFKGIIPSIQPIHAMSDRRWALKKLCPNRMPGAYAYNSLLQAAGIVAIGTDFPVEHPNPIENFKSAVVRKSQSLSQWNGVIPNEGLHAEDALFGMTKWAAYSLFMENICGSLRPNLEADFVLLSHDLLKQNIDFDTKIAVKEMYFKGVKLDL